MGLESTTQSEGGRLAELASGIDALYMSGSAELRSSLLADLAGWRQAAAESEDPVRIELLGESFRVGSRAWGRYPYFLEHVNGRLGFTDSQKLPAVRIQPRTEHLHADGPRAAVDWWRDLVEAFTGGVLLSPSRMDLYSDWQGWELTAGEGSRFKCRASRRATYEDGSDFTGFVFGRRKTGTINARIYDKTRQAGPKGLDWLRLVWGDRYDPAARVLRVEFEIARRGLRDFGIGGMDAALDAAAAVWATLTESWLSHRIPTADETTARWPVSPEWTAVQRPSFVGDAPGRERIRQAQKAQSVRTVIPGLAGYLSTLGALEGADDLDETLAVLPGHIRDYGIWSGRTFDERLRSKRAGFA